MIHHSARFKPGRYFIDMGARGDCDSLGSGVLNGVDVVCDPDVVSDVYAV
ncbi:MAG: hypothetical protein IIC11_04495 [Proteobacteria bacterium]|nr:hypothetical protein [Pseudomonadota bacterium]